MITLQMTSNFLEDKKDFAPFLPSKRQKKRPAKRHSRSLGGEQDLEETRGSAREAGSVNLESIYFRGFRTRPLLA